MAMYGVLVRADPGRPVLGPEVLAELTALGVTSVSLIGDATTHAWVVEGWRFDPGRSGADVLRLLSHDGRAQPLRPLMHAVVTTDPPVPVPSAPLEST